MDRPSERLDLSTAVIDVIFTRDIEAGALEQGCQGIARDGPPRMADMQAPGGVRRAVLDIHLLSRTEIGSAVILALFEEQSHLALPEFRPHLEIDETRPCRPCSGHLGILAHDFGQPLGDAHGILAHGLGEHEGCIGRCMAMARITWRIDTHPCEIDTCRKFARGLHASQRADHLVVEDSERVREGRSSHGCQLAISKSRSCSSIA